MWRKFASSFMALLALLALAGCTMTSVPSSIDKTVVPTASSTPMSTTTSIVTVVPSPTPGASRFKLPEGDEPGFLAPRAGDPQLRLAFSPAGDVLATGNLKGRVDLWSISTGEHLQELQPPDTQDLTGAVDTIAFSPDGTLIAASRPWRSRVDLWNVRTGEFVRSLQGSYGMKAVLFSPDGELLLGGVPRGPEPSDLGAIFIWDTSSGTTTQTLKDVAPPMAFSLDSAVLATAYGRSALVFIEPGAIIIWNVLTGQQAKTLRLTGSIIDIDYDSERQILAASIVEGDIGHPVGRVILIDATTGSVLHEMKIHPPDPNRPFGGAADDLRFNPDYSLLVGHYQGNWIVIWDVATREQIRVIEGPANVLQYPIFSPDGSLLAASSSDRRILFWKLSP